MDDANLKKSGDASSAYRVIQTTAKKLFVKPTAANPKASYNSGLSVKIKSIVQNVEGFDNRIRTAYTDLLSRTINRLGLPACNRTREVLAVAVLCSGSNLKNLQTQEELLRLLMQHHIEGEDIHDLAKWVVDMGWYEYPQEKTTEDILNEIHECSIQDEVRELLDAVSLGK